MGNYIYYGYNSLRRTVTSEPAVKKVDTATSVVKVSRPDCESTPIEKVTVITTPVVKEEPKMENVEVKEVKVKVKEVEVKVEKKEVKEEPKKEVEVKVKEVKVKEEQKKEVEVKVEPKKEVEVKVKEVKVKEEPKKEVKEEPKKEVEVKVEKKEVKEVEEKIVIDLKNVTKEKTKSPLLTPIEEESIYVHPYLLEYGTEPFKSDILLIQNEMYQPNKKKNKKKKNQPNVFSEE
jgi:hypothetical protein